MPVADRLLILASGLSGAAGVALSAAAAHKGGAFIGTASFLLMHAPAFLALGIFGASRMLRIAGLILLVGVVLFSVDLAARDFLGSRLFPLAAPAGGTLLIIGWLAVALSAFSGGRGPTRAPTSHT